MQELKSTLKKAEADRTLAQQELHDLQLQLREVASAKAAAGPKQLAPDDANIHHLILAMEEQGIGTTLARLFLLTGG